MPDSDSESKNSRPLTWKQILGPLCLGGLFSGGMLLIGLKEEPIVAFLSPIPLLAAGGFIWLHRWWWSLSAEIQHTVQYVGGGILACLVGIFLLLVSIFDPWDEAFEAGRAPVAFAGAAFFLAGAAILRSVVAPHSRTVGRVVAILLIATMGGVPAAIFLSTWVRGTGNLSDLVFPGLSAAIVFGLLGIVFYKLSGKGKRPPEENRD